MFFQPWLVKVQKVKDIFGVNWGFADAWRKRYRFTTLIAARYTCLLEFECLTSQEASCTWNTLCMPEWHLCMFAQKHTEDLFKAESTASCYCDGNYKTSSFRNLLHTLYKMCQVYVYILWLSQNSTLAHQLIFSAFLVLSTIQSS